MNPALTTAPTAEPVTMSDMLNVASWNRQRTDDELRSFIARRENSVANLVTE